MKKEFKKYKQYELSAVEDKLSKKNKQILESFMTFCATAGEGKKKNIKRVIVKIIDTLECDLDKFTPEILLKLLNITKESDLQEATRNEIKKHIKRFINYYYEDPKILKVLKQFKLKNDANHEKVNPETIVKENEVPILMRGTDNIRYKTLIILSWETAGRPQEILDLKWEDIDFENNTIKLRCAKKGGEARVLPIQESVVHLERLRDEWTFADRNKEDFVFVGQNRGKRLSNTMWESELKKIAQKTLNRDLNPYLIRHGRLTSVQDELPPKTYEDFADHSLAVATRYRHKSQGQLVDSMKKNLYNVKKLTPQEKDKIKKLELEIEEMKKMVKTMWKGYAEQNKVLKTAVKILK